jgi:tetratricopeptide (TPR) repeat protein
MFMPPVYQLAPNLRVFIAASWIFLFAGVGLAQSSPAKLSAAGWQADLQFLAERMPKQHPNLFRRISKADFDTAVRQLNDRIPAATEEEILVGLMRIVAMVKDGHTGMFPAERFQSGIFPVRFYLYDDGLFVQRAAPAHAGLVGKKVSRIANLTADEAIARVATLVAADNEMGRSENAPLLLSIPEILRGSGIIMAGQDLDIVVETAGKESTVSLKAGFSVNQLLNPPSDWADFSGKKPLYLQHPDDLYWFEYLKDQKVLYVQQNAVQNKRDETVARFYERVMEFVAANPVDKLVIDLRRNDGGNNDLNRPVIRAIIKSRMDERGRLFVITGRRTFSAAQNFVNEFEKYTSATFVGEPTAGRPNHYGDGRPVRLPNSRLTAQVSTLHWQDMDPRDDRPWTAPEIAAANNSTDYRNGDDPALNAIISYRPGSGFRAVIDQAKEKDIAAFVRDYEAFKADRSHRYVETEAAINRLGYDLLGAGRAKDAVEVFKLNTKAYPGSANAFDSLGDGYSAVGSRDEAIKSYERALAIDPGFASSIESLRKLKAQP